MQTESVLVRYESSTRHFVPNEQDTYNVYFRLERKKSFTIFHAGLLGGESMARVRRMIAAGGSITVEVRSEAWEDSGLWKVRATEAALEKFASAT